MRRHTTGITESPEARTSVAGPGLQLRCAGSSQHQWTWLPQVPSKNLAYFGILDFLCEKFSLFEPAVSSPTARCSASCTHYSSTQQVVYRLCALPRSCDCSVLDCGYSQNAPARARCFPCQLVLTTATPPTSMRSVKCAPLLCLRSPRAHYTGVVTTH